MDKQAEWEQKHKAMQEKAQKRIEELGLSGEGVTYAFLLRRAAYAFNDSDYCRGILVGRYMGMSFLSGVTPCLKIFKKWADGTPKGKAETGDMSILLQDVVKVFSENDIKDEFTDF